MHGSQMSRLESLPSEILLDILSDLGLSSLVRVALTSRSIRQIALQDSLWKPFVHELVIHTSPPSTASHIREYCPSVPIWHPEHKSQTDIAPFAPRLEEFVADTTSLDHNADIKFLSLDLFPGAGSWYQVYTTFLSQFEPLLGWWASDVPSYGMVVRVILDVFRTDDSPAFICQQVHLTNRLLDNHTDVELWRNVVGFPMPPGIIITGNGTSLLRNLTQIRTDVSETGIRTEELWSFSWKDATDAARPQSAEQHGGQTAAKIKSDAWVKSLASHEAPEPLSEEDLEQATQDLIEVPRRRALNLGLAPDAITRRSLEDLGQLLVETDVDATNGEKQLMYALSGIVSMRPQDGRNRDIGLVNLRRQPWQPYRNADESNASFSEGSIAILPQAPVIFPPPALLCAVRATPQSTLRKRTIGTSGIQEDLSAYSRYILDGREVLIDSLVMNPPPPFRPWPVYGTGSVPRFFPLINPPRSSVLAKPRLTNSHTSSNVGEGLEFEHTAPPPHLDPAYTGFDWSAVEGLYSMTYGPHGMELLYVRARALTLLDFGTDDSLPDWPAEPDMSTDAMYDHMRIDRRAAQRVGARVLEGIKVLGDPNIPRGQITWRAFIDDPDRSGVRWRAPPPGYRTHTPWPLRAPHNVDLTDVRSPGLVLPAHGRVAGEGFVGPGWAPALACISSVDELQIWWQPMYKVSVAKKLIGV